MIQQQNFCYIKQIITAEGTPNPKPCKAGTYGNGTGFEYSSQCKDCTAGFYCPGVNQTYPKDECYPGKDNNKNWNEIKLHKSYCLNFDISHTFCI